MLVVLSECLHTLGKLKICLTTMGIEAVHFGSFVVQLEIFHFTLTRGSFVFRRA